MGRTSNIDKELQELTIEFKQGIPSRINIIESLWQKRTPNNMDEKIFKQDAKQIVDLAFDNKLFKDEITRDDMNGFQSLIQFLLSTAYPSYLYNFPASFISV